MLVKIGKGVPRRKVAPRVQSAAQGEDKKLQAGLAKLKVQPIVGKSNSNPFIGYKFGRRR